MGRAWFDRRFRFDHLGEDDFPYVVERLRGTPSRIAAKIEGVPREVLARRDGDSWSVQEHIGHLLVLDALHDGRLDDYEAGAEELRPADLRNRATHEGGYNDREAGELLDAFRRGRGRLVERLDSWEPRLVAATATHPRLEQPMRVVDMAWFTAEHDDHHLERMTRLLGSGRD